MNLTNKIALFFGTTLLSSALFSPSGSASGPSYACAFTKPVVFGASISAGFEEIGDGARGALASVTGFKYYGKNTDPTTGLARRFHGNPSVLNISEIVNTMPNNAYGYEQIKDYLGKNKGNPERLSRLTEASLLSTIDGFYWPAGDGNCLAAVRGAADIIQFAKRHNQALILATVPEEDPSKVNIILRNGGWYPPVEECVEMINSFMKRSCHAEDQCYLIDIHDVVKRLNSTGIEFEGQIATANNNAFRFDGVHLTRMGVRYIMSLIEKAMIEHPPFCAQK